MVNPDYTTHLPLSELPIAAPAPATLAHQKFSIENDGIYHGLPVYDNSTKGKTAILAGANGISGTHMLRALARHPEIWASVHALSRRPPMANLPSNFSEHVQHHVIDLLTSPEQVGRELMEGGITNW